MAGDTIPQTSDFANSKSATFAPLINGLSTADWQSNTQVSGKGEDLAKNLDVTPIWQRAAAADQPVQSDIPEGYRALQSNETPERGDKVVIPGRKDLVMTVGQQVMRDWSTTPTVHTIDLNRLVTSELPLADFKRKNPTAMFLRKQ